MDEQERMRAQGRVDVMTAAQDAAVRDTSESHDALRQAENVLVRALARPQPFREARWAERVADAVMRLQAVLREHRLQVQGPGGLYDELRTEAPWLLPRLQQLTAQLRRLESEATDLAAEVVRVRDGDLQNVGAIRGDAERMLALLRDLVSREADLMYERFRDLAALD
jgi:hypothetical protein